MLRPTASLHAFDCSGAAIECDLNAVPELSKVRTLWLADHLLFDERGHHLSHAGYIADAAKRAGMGVRILCARKCRVKVAGGFRMDGIFRQDLRNSPSRLISKSRIALDLLEFVACRTSQADLASGLRQAEGTQWILPNGWEIRLVLPAWEAPWRIKGFQKCWLRSTRCSPPHNLSTRDLLCRAASRIIGQP